MAAAAIHVVPDDNFDDWVVRADIGQEFGHYPTREAAERVAQAIAQEREAELVNSIGAGVFQGGFDALKRVFGG